MNSRIRDISLVLAMALLGGVPAAAQATGAAATTAKAAFVAPNFAVPTLVETPHFKLVPLGPALVRADFEACMSSVEHLQKTFTRSTAWPHAGISIAEAMKDMDGEQARFRLRIAFSYAVLTPDGKRERGCVYVSSSPVPGYDAQVRIWVTKAEYDAGFDAELYAWATKWVKTEWPFERVAYPGRAIGWRTWDALAAVQGAK